jgi:hypothetical protein
MEVEIRSDVLFAPDELRLGGEHGLQPLAFTHDRLRFFGVRPEIRVGNLLFNFAQLLAQFAGVKDTPAGRALCP